MKKTSLLLLAFVAALSACGGGKKTIHEQQAQLTSLQSEKNSLLSDIKDKESRIAAVEGEKAEAEGKAKETAEKLAAAQAQIESLQQSNESLSKSMASSKGEMANELRAAIAEKDKLAKKLNDLAKEKSAVERQRATVSAKLGIMKSAAESYEKKLSAADEAAKADAARAQKERSDRLAAAREDLGKLADAVLKEIEAEQISAEQKGETVELSIRHAALFDANKAKLTQEGTALLDRLAEPLRAFAKRPIRVEGHSDNSKIKWELFGYSSHWDLSSARATAVARYLHEKAGLDPRQIAAVGYGEWRPVKANDTPENRAANQRIVVALDPARP